MNFTTSATFACLGSTIWEMISVASAVSTRPGGSVTPSVVSVRFDAVMIRFQPGWSASTITSPAIFRMLRNSGISESSGILAGEVIVSVLRMVASSYRMFICIRWEM